MRNSTLRWFRILYWLALLIVGTASSLVFVIFGVLGIDHSNKPDTLTAVFRAIASGFGFAAAVTLMSRLSEKYERPYIPAPVNS